MELSEKEKLTPEEKAYLQKHLDKKRPKWASWTIWRWFGLFVPFMLIGLSVVTFSLYQNLYNIPDLLFERSFQLSKNQPVSQTTLDTHKSYLLLKILYSNRSMFGFVSSIVKLIMGLFILIYTLANWNRHLHEQVMNKIYRRLLRENSDEG